MAAGLFWGYTCISIELGTPSETTHFKPPVQSDHIFLYHFRKPVNFSIITGRQQLSSINGG